MNKMLSAMIEMLMEEEISPGPFSFSKILKFVRAMFRSREELRICLFLPWLLTWTIHFIIYFSALVTKVKLFLVGVAHEQNVVSHDGEVKGRRNKLLFPPLYSKAIQLMYFFLNVFLFLSVPKSSH